MWELPWTEGLGDSMGLRDRALRATANDAEARIREQEHQHRAEEYVRQQRIAKMQQLAVDRVRAILGSEVITRPEDWKGNWTDGAYLNNPWEAEYPEPYVSKKIEGVNIEVYETGEYICDHSGIITSNFRYRDAFLTVRYFGKFCSRGAKIHLTLTNFGEALRVLDEV
jgi:hypothetical protein